MLRESVVKGCWGSVKGAEIVKQSPKESETKMLNISKKRELELLGNLETARQLVASLELNLKFHDDQMKKMENSGVEKKVDSLF